MNTLSVSVRYRPIRIGWCMLAGDFAALREALRLTFTMWGGRYNPFIPVDDFNVADALVHLFRVDFLWPVSNDERVKKFIERFPHFPNPFLHEDLFVPCGGSELCPQLIDISHPIRRLYEEDFKNNPSPDVSVRIVNWQNDDPLADVLLSTFGALPPLAETGTDYLALLTQYLSAVTLALSPKESLPHLGSRSWTLSTFSGAFLKHHYSIQNLWGHPGLYVGNSSDFVDLVTFWNLRATDASLMFYDARYSERFETNLTSWLDILRSRPKGPFEPEASTAIWFKECLQQPDVTRFGNGLLLCAVNNQLWNGLNIRAPYIYFSEGSSLAAIGEDSRGLSHVSFQLPSKPFREDILKVARQHVMVSVNPGIGLFGNERATLQTLYVPELNEYYGRQCYFEWNKARVEPAGLGVITHATRSDLSLKALEVVDLVKQLFSVVGIDAQISKPGLVAARLIQQMGGLQGCRPFKIAGVRQLIEKYPPDHSFTRSGAIQAIRGASVEKYDASFGAYENLYIEPRPRGTKLTPDAVFAYLLRKGVFRTGLRFDCPSCRLQFWTPLDDVRSETSCEYCGHRFNIAPYLRDRDWAFRRTGLFGRDDHQEGAIPTILTLQQLQTALHSDNMLYTTAMELKITPSASPDVAVQKCETDFVVVIPRSIDHKIHIAIGECKTRKEITDDDVNNLKAVTEAFPNDRFEVFVMLSKLTPFSPVEIERVQRLNNKYIRRVILFTNRELEPYFLYDRTAQEFKIDRYAVSFQDMARVTEQVFFRCDNSK